MEIDAAGLTEVGGREHNEDALVVAVDLGLFAMADGMGGYACGEVASDMVVRIVEDVVDNRLLTSEDSPKKVLETALQLANQEVFRRAQREPDHRGMGSTAVVLLIRQDHYWVAHVGDSRAYRLRGKKLEQLTQDHSLVQNLVERGVISPEDAKHHPQRHIITRSLGTEAQVQVDLKKGKIQAGDQFLLCSDGLYGVLEERVIRAILQRSADAGTAAKRLIQAAKEARTDDNITALVIRAKVSIKQRLLRQALLAAALLVLAIGAGAWVGTHPERTRLLFRQARNAPAQVWRWLKAPESPSEKPRSSGNQEQESAPPVDQNEKPAPADEQGEKPASSGDQN